MVLFIEFHVKIYNPIIFMNSHYCMPELVPRYHKECNEGVNYETENRIIYIERKESNINAIKIINSYFHISFTM